MTLKNAGYVVLLAGGGGAARMAEGLAHAVLGFARNLGSTPVEMCE